jgi:hypothetical protein
MSAGGGKPRRSGRAMRDAAATEAGEESEKGDSAEYADQNEDSSNLPGAGMRGKKQSKGGRWAVESLLAACPEQSCRAQC